MLERYLRETIDASTKSRLNPNGTAPAIQLQPDDNDDDDESHEETMESVCQVCSFVFSTNENLSIHMRNIHSKFDDSEFFLEKDDHSNDPGNNIDMTAHKEASKQNHRVSVKQVGDSKLKCEQCSYSSVDKSNMKKHIRGVHEKIKNHKCEECGYAATQKNSLIQHRAYIHKIGEKKFKCDQCPYKSFLRGTVKRHIYGVHDKIRNNVCDECGHAFNEKKDLENHKISVHKMGEEKFKCDLCPYKSRVKNNLSRHVKSTHFK